MVAWQIETFTKYCIFLQQSENDIRYNKTHKFSNYPILQFDDQVLFSSTEDTGNLGSFFRGSSCSWIHSWQEHTQQEKKGCGYVPALVSNVDMMLMRTSQWYLRSGFVMEKNPLI